MEYYRPMTWFPLQSTQPVKPDAHMMSERRCTADLCDHAGADLRIADIALRSFGGITFGSGPARLVQLDDDNRILFDVLGEPGMGAILLVKVQSAAHPAVVGENVARRALENGWAGLVVDGSVRDVGILASIPLLIVAREPRPFRMRTESRGAEVDSFLFGGVTVRTNDIVVVDEDGIVFLDGPER